MLLWHGSDTGSIPVESTPILEARCASALRCDPGLLILAQWCDSTRRCRAILAPDEPPVLLQALEEVSVGRMPRSFPPFGREALIAAAGLLHSAALSSCIGGMH